MDVQQTNDRIEKFRQENKEVIAANLAKQVKRGRGVRLRSKPSIHLLHTLSLYHLAIYLYTLLSTLKMNEEKAISYRIEKEKRDKMLRKEAYLSQIQEMDKLKRMEQEDIIRQLVFTL